MMTGPGLYQVQGRSDPLTTDIDLTVTAAGFAPQVVTVPFKPGVTRVPGAGGAVAAGRGDVDARRDPRPDAAGRGAPRHAAGDRPGDARDVRFALLDGRYLPGQAIRAGAGGELLQAAAVLYLENVGAGSFPANTQVALGNASTPPVFGAEGGRVGLPAGPAGAVEAARSRRRQLPGHRRPAPVPAQRRVLGHRQLDAPPRLRARPRAKAGRRRLRRAPACACWDPTASPPPTRPAPTAASAPAPPSRRPPSWRWAAPPAPSTCPPRRSPAPSAALTDACTAIGDVTLDSADDCDRPPVLVSGRRQPGESCTRTLECAGLASCHKGFCVGESFARVSMTWTANSDFDLHVRRSTGQELSRDRPEAGIKGVGRLDVQQCTTRPAPAPTPGEHPAQRHRRGTTRPGCRTSTASRPPRGRRRDRPQQSRSFAGARQAPSVERQPAASRSQRSPATGAGQVRSRPDAVTFTLRPALLTGRTTGPGSRRRGPGGHA